MSSEDVARNQRARLYGAMIESVSSRGYDATTVADLVALAGVSRRSYYELFANKEQCFLATHRSLLARQRRRLIDVWRGGRGWEERLQLACETLLQDIAAHPKGPRLVLVDSLWIGLGAQAQLQLTGAAFECLVAAVLRQAHAASDPDGVSSRAIVGGIRQVVFLRMLERREHELAALGGEVLDWIDRYRAPAAAQLATLEPRARCRPGASALTLDACSERARVLASAVQLTLEEGFARVSDRRIAVSAGISTARFHGHFRDKHECLMAALDEFMRGALDRVRGALEAGRSWPEGVDRAMQALVGYLLAKPQLLRLAFLEPLAAGPSSVGGINTSIERLTALLTADAPPPRSAPNLASEAITGAISAVIAGHVAGGRRPRPPCLADHLTSTVLAPFLGARVAVEEIGAARRSLAA